MVPLYPAPQIRSRYKRIFSLQNIVGFTVGFVVASATAFLFAKNSVDYTVLVDGNGVGQPQPLFDLAERADRNLRLDFAPAELRSVYVCEFKRLSGENYTALVLRYLDAYRDCFDVSVQGENEFRIFPSTRRARLQQKEGVFFCRCNAALPD